MIINNAWYVSQLPDVIVVELENRELRMFKVTPYRLITAIDLQRYVGYHPRKIKGQPLPEYLFKFYGLEKNQETASEVIHIRLTPTEYNMVKTDAGNNSVSEYVRGMLL